jgi:hypothetical protein
MDIDHTTFVQCPKRALKNSIFEKYIKTIDVEDIRTKMEYVELRQYINNTTINLLIIDLSFVNKHGIDAYLEQYFSSNNFEKYVKICAMNDIMTTQYDTFETRRARIQLLHNSIETLYWQLQNNCKLNITGKFLKRDIIDTTYANVKANSNIMLSNNKISDEDYIYNLINGESHINISTNGNSAYWKSNAINLTNEDINAIIMHKLITDEEKYHLIMNLLSSKTHCHLIINNRFMLLWLYSTCFVDRHYEIFRYILSYVWISLSMDEFITKSNMTNNDRFVFDIEDANLLPQMPIINHKTPYLPILISNKIRAKYKNLSCPKKIYNDSIKYGVCTLETFKIRLNYFICNRDINLLENVDWKDIGICGSVMACCLPNFNPLFANFMSVSPFNPQDIRMINFINYHYNDADIDIACNGNYKKCFDTVLILRETIEENIKNNINRLQTFGKIDIKDIVRKITLDTYDEIDNTITIDDDDMVIVPNIKTKVKTTLEQKINDKDNLVFITPFKSANIYINNRFIQNYLIIRDSNDDVDDIDKKIQDIKDIIFKINNNEVKTMDEIKYIRIIYDIYVKEFNCSQNDVDEKYLICNTIVPEESVRIFYSDRDTNMIYYSHTIKYSLTSNYFRIPFELFKCRSDEIIGTVSQFHFPIVRSYYCGKTVKMTPSCIGACMTFINIDYKFFAGVRDPIIIWIKYYKRGMGFLFNGTEISKFVAFCMNNPQYVAKRGLLINDRSGIAKYLTSRYCYDPLYTDNIPTNQFYQGQDCNKMLLKDSPYNPFTCLLNAIDNDGNVKPLNYHMIIALYEFYKARICKPQFYTTYSSEFESYVKDADNVDHNESNVDHNEKIDEDEKVEEDESLWHDTFH